MIRVRFAPSPTGALHIGGARTALFNFLFARSQGGVFVLRIDDTDKERSNIEFEKDILECLDWLGLTPDEGPTQGGAFGPYRQTERIDSHIEAAKKLESSDKAYKDEKGTVRLRYPEDEIVVNDIICGQCHFRPISLGPEPVILRSDGTPTYQLASVVDDIEMKITHVIRGQDHLTNTAKQQVIFEALGSELPVFAHLPLILGTDGSKLSKRNSEGLVSVREFKEAGFLPEALFNFLVLLGWSHPDAKEQIAIDEAIKTFSLDRVSSTAAVFDGNKLKWLNGWWLRHLPVSEVAEAALPFTDKWQAAIKNRGSKFWENAVSKLRDGFSSLSDAKNIAELLIADNIEVRDDATREYLTEETREVCKKVANAWISLIEQMPTSPDSDSYSEQQFKQLSALLKKSTALSGKALFQPLRVVITGALSGPELKILVPLLPREMLLSRARGFL
jgi:nondiscriminating glutamyl-tRNA synthetase